MARDQGSDYVEILQHYYAGVTVEGPTPNLITSAQVTPNAGTDLTEFVFTATYDGPSLVLPAVANVVIDGRAYAMARVPTAVGSGYHPAHGMEVASGAVDILPPLGVRRNLFEMSCERCESARSHCWAARDHVAVALPACRAR